MIITVFEIYSDCGKHCLLFLTEQEARNQKILSLSDGPYEAQVEISEEEFIELTEERYLWV